MKDIKVKIIRTLALTILNKNIFEQLLCYLSRHIFFRNLFHINALPIAYTYILDKPEIRIAKVGNYKFYVNIAEYSGVSLYFFGEHNEAFSAWLVSQLVNQGDICIDIGANVGSYTFLMASNTGSEGNVFAFEPQQNLYKLLLDSVKMNEASSFISVDCRALYSKSGETLKFYLSDNPSNSGTSSLINHGVFVREENHILIQTVTLTDYFQEKRIEKSKLVKIDVERAELEVLQGMNDLLKEQRIDYIVLEQLAGSESQEILLSMAYQGWLIDENLRLLVDINKIEPGTFANYLFVSPKVINEFQNNYANLVQS
jgi:FkbM family methyltransferase